MKNIDETIRARHSVRSYIDKEINKEEINKLNEIIEECNKDANLNIQLILNDGETFDNYILHYGKIKNAKNYLAMVGKKDKLLEEKIGYYGEKIVLEAQELGLNTCWVAGTYNKGKVKAKIKDDEELVCIIAIGYGVNNGVSCACKTFKNVSLSKNTPDWYNLGIEYALLAPTAINQQKFKFKLLGDNIVSIKMGIDPMIKIDLGIVKYHFELGAKKENFKWK